MSVLETLREATRGTPYEGHVYLVGGVVRDQILGIPSDEDTDLVLEGDALAFARFLHEKGITQSSPVTYPRFGTAMVLVDGSQVEIASARAESYSAESRKPEVVPASLADDVLRRDFTINTLLRNLHTGEMLDLTGTGRADIAAGIIRTPREPDATFDDDPLRMLRAVRFAARFGFTIDDPTWQAIVRKAPRLAIVSLERIRDELAKLLLTTRAAEGIEMLRETGLLARFLPELETMVGVTQNDYHIYDVWHHTLHVLSALPVDAGLDLRLAALFHDIGKPATRTVGDDGFVHFYTHQAVGRRMTAAALTRLRFSGDTIARVSRIVELHLRVGEDESDWSDAAVRRLIRDAGDDLRALIDLTVADKAASNTDMPSVDIEALEARIASVTAQMDVVAIRSPLDGGEVMSLLGIGEGPLVGEVKSFLVDEIIEGRLAPGDASEAQDIVLRRWGRGSAPNS